MSLSEWGSASKSNGEEFFEVSGRLAARKERSDGLAKNGADLEEASATDAIAALLVFLDLLKRKSEFYSQVCLR